MSVDKRTSKFIGMALAVSSLSTYGRVRIGTVITRGNKIVSQGANLCTSHPLQRTFNELSGRVAPAHNLHSELHAIIRGKFDKLRGCNLYVARLDRRGMWAFSRPCPACALAIRMAGIARVTYTSPSGIHTYTPGDL